MRDIKNSTFYDASLDDRPPIFGLIDLYKQGKDVVEYSIRKKSIIKQVLAKSPIGYYHYNMAGENDIQWGCAYRAIQMILSSYRIRNIRADNPSIDTIQKRLYALQRIPKEKLGTHVWVEPPDCHAYLTRILKLPSMEMNYGDIKKRQPYDIAILPKDEKGRKVLIEHMYNHFEIFGTPIMIDDGLKAYALGGIRTVKDHSLNKSWSECLRLDPHQYEYLTIEEYKKLYIKGSPNPFVRWIPFDEVFYGKGWMLCFPQTSL